MIPRLVETRSESDPTLADDFAVAVVTSPHHDVTNVPFALTHTPRVSVPLPMCAEPGLRYNEADLVSLVESR